MSYRLDHTAFRVKDRTKAAQFFIDSMNYKIQTEFDINFEDGSIAKCLALEPPEKGDNYLWQYKENHVYSNTPNIYHLPSEIFISDGSPGSIVDNWVEERIKGGGSFLHHVAYQVEHIEDVVSLWKNNNWAEFATDHVLQCEGLKQIFTKPHPLLGHIIELIERKHQGFCKDNVQKLMQSSINENR